MYQDPELIAMSEVHGSLKSLETGQIKRVLDWISSRLNVELEEAPPETPELPVIPTAQVVPVVQLAQPIVSNLQPVVEPPAEPVAAVEADEADEAGEAEVGVETTPEPEAHPIQDENKKPMKLSTKGLGLKRYKNIENLFLAAEIKSVGSRVLLAAAYLQEKNDYEEMSSYDINSRLKKLGYGVSNITTAINTLLNKKTPLMMQTKKEGTSKQAKRKFKVTEEGLDLAKTFLRSAVE